ncbi:hypothetical protein OG298_39420 [Streptomyces sp. NBC_01005]|uniref:hypothetical protein n=1 Tax=unclassified Streptomyces TaxID=2593676 RepID=UPI00387018AC|nr:hypothetical protein OG298_39420 [Streptomyces sp. NBC_01005]WTC99475.1 hypothetical protein OH736_39435 [Streptomyces sp. NBC_01650]
MTEVPHPPPLSSRWRARQSGFAYAPQDSADLRQSRRRAALLIVLLVLLAVAGVIACVSAVAQWGQEYIELSDRFGATAAYRPAVVLAGGLVLLLAAGFGVVGARAVARPRKPAVELTPDVVRSNWLGTVEVPWSDVVGVQVTNGPHLRLARQMGAYRVAGKPRREDNEPLLRLYAPANDVLPLVEWLRAHPEVRATALVPGTGLLPAEHGGTGS